MYFINGDMMYLDYNVRITIIAFIFYKKNITSILKKIIVLKIINNLIDAYNDYYLKKCTLKVTNHKYNIEQIKAIYSDELFNLILAGAGSGKTSTIVGKINYLIEEKKINARDIICFSFTNEACNNLISRLQYKVNVYTFHKFALQILNKKYYIDNNYLDYVIDEYFKGILIHNKKMVKKLLKYLKNKKIKEYKDLFSSNDYTILKNNIKCFINLFKSNGYNYFNFKKKNKRVYRYIYLVINDILYVYNKELQATNTIDLDLLIIKATNYIKYNNLQYKYIIIDEFQDISKVRFDLIMEIIKNTNAKLMAVGDDYQAIYSFSGCDMNLLLNLYRNKYNTKVIYLKNNYRFCQELVNISNNFIISNKKQLKKRIISHKSISKPIVIIKEKDNILEKLLKYLISEKDILILGRNNNDIYKYLNSNLKYNNGKILYNSNNINYKTVHSAKGLEADCVIIINLNNNITGFPSKIKNCDFINYFFSKENYAYAEERRLFYVALTRTKTKVYLLYPNNPSIFILELIKKNKKRIEYLNL